MSVTYTSDPSSAPPGSVVGNPIRLPYIMLCQHGGERFCGWVRVAHTQVQLADLMIERRRHEQGCLGGLIPGRG